MDRRTFLGAAGAVWMGSASARVAEQAGVSDGEILLGQSAVLSGPLGPAVANVRAGAQLVFSETNTRGGVNGRQIRLKSIDDGLDPKRAAANYQALANEHQVFACVLGVGVATTRAALPVLRESGMPLVGALAVTDSVRDESSGLVYYTRATQRRESEAHINHLTTLGINRIALATFDTPGGAEVAQQVSDGLDKRGVKLLGVAKVGADGSRAAEAADELAALNPQAVIVYLNGVPAATVMKGMGEKGVKPAFYGMSIVSGEVTAKLLNGHSMGLAISQVTPYPWDAASADANQYRKLAERAGVPVGYHSYEGYLAARTLVEALHRTGRELARSRLHATLRAMKMRVAGMELDFSGGRATGSGYVELVRVRDNGSFVR